MNNKSRSDCVNSRFTRVSERNKKEEEDVKKRKKTDTVVCLSNRTRLEEKNREAFTFGKRGYREYFRR